jgi:hypothetical protein
MGASAVGGRDVVRSAPGGVGVPFTDKVRTHSSGAGADGPTFRHRTGLRAMEASPAAGRGVRRGARTGRDRCAVTAHAATPIPPKHLGGSEPALYRQKRPWRAHHARRRVSPHRPWRGARSFPEGVGNGSRMEARQGAMRNFFRNSMSSGAPQNPPSRLHLMRDPVNRPLARPRRERALARSATSPDCASRVRAGWDRCAFGRRRAG